MEIVTLEQLKWQVNVDSHDTTYDTQLVDMAEEAEEYVLAQSGHPAEWYVERYGRIPPALRRAVLLLVGDWFAYREGGRPTSVSRAEETVINLVYRYTLVR